MNIIASTHSLVLVVHINYKLVGELAHALLSCQWPTRRHQTATVPIIGTYRVGQIKWHHFTFLLV